MKNFQLSRLKSQLRDTQREARTLEDKLQKVRDIEGMISGRLIFSDLAHDIYHSLPSHFYLVSMSLIHGQGLSVQGISSNSREIDQFQKGMAGSPYFSNVNIDYVNKRVTAQGEVYYFKFTCTFKSSEGQK
jgi:Tfp pilus assembly protein PilN